MNLTYENNFLGAVVSKDSKNLIVYKVNAKTFYAGEMPYEVFLNRFDKAKKGTTFKEFVAEVKANSFSYEGFSISDEESQRGKKAGIKKIVKNEKRLLSSRGESALRDAYLTRYKKGKGCKYPLYDGTMEFHIVAAHPENKVLLNLDGQYVLYGFESKTFFVVEEIASGKLRMDTIPWEKIA